MAGRPTSSPLHGSGLLGLRARDIGRPPGVVGAPGRGAAAVAASSRPELVPLDGLWLRFSAPDQVSAESGGRRGAPTAPPWAARGRSAPRRRRDTGRSADLAAPRGD